MKIHFVKKKDVLMKFTEYVKRIGHNKCDEFDV